MYTLFQENGQYGVQGDQIRVADITPNIIEAYALIYLLNEYQVSHCHVCDVIEDFLGVV